jgi:hypothetical protein
MGISQEICIISNIFARHSIFDNSGKGPEASRMSGSHMRSVLLWKNEILP